MMKNPPHPGLSVRYDCLEPLELSVTEVARKLGVGRKQLSELVNARSGISPEMAIRLDKAFGGNTLLDTYQPPVTGGKNATSSPARTGAPRCVYSRFTATNMLPGIGCPPVARRQASPAVSTRASSTAISRCPVDSHRLAKNLTVIVIRDPSVQPVLFTMDRRKG